MSTLASGNFERIWLEPREGADPYIGRQWCQDNQWGEDGVEYVRADLMPTAPRDTISLTREEVAILLRAPNFEAYEKVSKRLVAFDRSEPAPPSQAGKVAE